jgi:hypothetical protein
MPRLCLDLKAWSPFERQRIDFFALIYATLTLMMLRISRVRSYRFVMIFVRLIVDKSYSVGPVLIYVFCHLKTDAQAIEIGN